jgi:c(7)-type cytochrome triheme protein
MGFSLGALLAVLVVLSPVCLADGAAGNQAPNRAKTALRLPSDIVYDKASDAPGRVVFSHSSHVAFEANRCGACHPRVFKMLRPSRRVTHAEMDAGASCGSCHDGRKAFGTADTERCDACHRGDEAGR